MGIEEKVFRTGLEAKKGRFAVSPDGRQIVFETDRIAHGLRLLNLNSGEIRVLPSEAGRTFGFPGWSPDGKQLAVVSAPVRDSRYVIDDIQIVLLDATTWRSRAIASGEGVKFFPFFSADGKTVYYFKGKKRESGKTVASRYDLFAIDLASGREEKLTDQEFFLAAKGNDDGNTILFSATPNFNKKVKDAFGEESRNALFRYGKISGNIALTEIDQSSGIFNFFTPQRDKAGNLFFVTAKVRPGGGNYLWFLVRSTPDGKSPAFLTQLPISMGFDIARNTGEIYVMDKQGEEIIFRKLPVLADH